MSVRTTIIAAFAIAGCKGGQPAVGPGAQVAGQPVETLEANAKDQKPAFAGQTRAPFKSASVAFDTQVIASGFEHPWAVAFLPDGKMLVTERPGRLLIVGAKGELSKPVAGLPAVDAREQGGLLDVAIDPAFAENRLIYWSYAEAGNGGNGTAVARGTLVQGPEPRVDDVKVVWSQNPKLDSTKHYGGRILFDKSGALIVTTGERSIEDGRKQAQNLKSELGKMIRVKSDGSIPDDNPYVGKADALPAIWSSGHRNIQAAAWNPTTGALWEIEHGTRGGDEINIVEKGKDYGWPTIAYGIEYTGGKINEGITQQAGMEQPIYYWDPVIAPSGMTFYTGDKFPAWKNSLFVGGLAAKHIARLTIENDRVVGEERLLVGRARIRDVRTGPDGFIYVLTDEDKGELLRLVPAATK